MHGAAQRVTGVPGEQLHSSQELRPPALLIAAGHDGVWHRDWTDPRTAAQARQTTDQLASVYRDQHRHDQELPQEP